MSDTVDDKQIQVWTIEGEDPPTKGGKAATAKRGTKIWTVDYDTKDNVAAVFHHHPAVYDQNGNTFFFATEYSDEGHYVCVGPKCGMIAPEKAEVLMNSLNVIQLKD